MDENGRHHDLADGLWESASSTLLTAEVRSTCDALYFEHARRHRLPRRRSASWATRATAIALEEAIELFRVDDESQRTALLIVDEVLVHVRLARGQASVKLACRAEGQSEAALERLRTALPAPGVPADVPRAPITFSWVTQHGVTWTTRTLDVASWDEISANYAAETRNALDALMRDFRPGDSGQTIIWHGEPGTGKTHALRALAYEWHEWCDVHVVTDPDRLFGSEADYLMEVIASPAGRRSPACHRLVVLEDAGELLTGDARALVGHGLSRFLNVCDGLLGQTERLILLVTTNEPLRRLHPAVRRPGRCAAEIEFLRLSQEEATRWLAGRSDLTVSGPTGIADLFALVNGGRPPGREWSGRPQVGFGATLAAERP